MTEPKRNEIVSRWRAGESMRRIARELGVTRNTVSRVLAEVEARRTGGGSHCRRRPSRLDAYEPVIEELLGRYPDLTAVRLLEELRQQGFSGSYSLVRQRLRELRPRSISPPVVRFETGPGAQAQMDYAVYDIDFINEGRRRVNLFSYILGYSRRQYLHFVETQDFATTLREHEQHRQAELEQRFAELGPIGRQFLAGLLRAQRYSRDQARRVLALWGTYARPDLIAALERAVHYGAYSHAAVERILAVQAKPKSTLETLAEEVQRDLPPWLGEDTVSPRPTSFYQPLCDQEPRDHEERNPPADDTTAGGAAPEDP
jgi:transposase